jgi:hypothetical protein
MTFRKGSLLDHGIGAGVGAKTLDYPALQNVFPAAFTANTIVLGVSANKDVYTIGVTSGSLKIMKYDKAGTLKWTVTAPTTYCKVFYCPSQDAVYQLNDSSATPAYYLVKYGNDGVQAWSVSLSEAAQADGYVCNDTHLFLNYGTKVKKVALSNGAVVWNHTMPITINSKDVNNAGIYICAATGTGTVSVYKLTADGTTHAVNVSASTTSGIGVNGLKIDDYNHVFVGPTAAGLHDLSVYKQSDGTLLGSVTGISGKMFSGFADATIKLKNGKVMCCRTDVMHLLDASVSGVLPTVSKLMPYTNTPGNAMFSVNANNDLTFVIPGTNPKAALCGFKI